MGALPAACIDIERVGCPAAASVDERAPRAADRLEGPGPRVPVTTQRWFVRCLVAARQPLRTHDGSWPG